MKSKKIMISGLAFDSKWITSLFSIRSGEEADMERLASEAKKGWIVTGFKGMSYVLTQGEPQDLIYAIDYKDNPEQDYFDIFKASGWEHISSIDYIHLFNAKEGTKPIHTSMETKLEKLSHEMRRFGVLTVIAVILLFGANALTAWATNMNIQWLIITALILNSISLIFTIFTLLPFFGYWSRVSRIKKSRI
jgi:hypothetical protein